MPNDTKPSSLLRSRLFYTLTAFAALGLFTLIGVWLYGRWSIEAQLDELRAQGLPTTAAEVNDYYVVPEGVRDTTDLWIAAIRAVEASPMSRRGQALPIIGEGPTPVPPPGKEWAELEAARTLLGELASEMALVRTAARARGQARYPLNMATRVQESFSAGRQFILDAHVAAHEGDNSRVLDDVKALFALSDSLRGAPILFSQRLRIKFHLAGSHTAVKLLPHTDWNDAELESLQEAIGSARFREEMQRAFIGERAICLTELNRMTLGPLRQANNRELLRMFEKLIDGISGPWAEVLDRQRELYAEQKEMMGGTLSRMRISGLQATMPDLEGSCFMGSLGAATQRSAIAAIQAERYRLQNGEWPASLAAIEPELNGVAAQLTDPFTGQLLRFKVEEDRLLIYSIGDDGKDDGGDFGDDSRPPVDFGFVVER